MAGNTALFLSRYIKYNSIIRSFNQPKLASRVVVNSVPKSGTHLLMKTLELLPGLERAPIQFGRQRIGLLFWCLGTCPSIRSVILSQFYAQKHVLRPNELNNVPIDADSPFYLSKAETRKIIQLIQPGWFAMGHLPHSPSLEEIITQERIKMLIILRDPRDVIISHANYLSQKNSHYMYPLFKSLSKRERIMASINGVPAGDSWPRLLNIRERINSITAWMNHPLTNTVRFEQLIGPNGGGSRDAQISEIKVITDHLEIELPPAKLARIADSVFGGTRTFRRGARGQWQRDYDHEHRQACKDLIGDILIELGFERDYDW